MRPDNMGDLIMSGPAIRALKETFGARITILTSSLAKPIVKNMPEIDEAIIYDLPWVKTAKKTDPDQFQAIIDVIKQGHFDAAVLFTVYSQNPLPTAMLAYLAGIPRILAYCRENPYGLISDWVPDKEPYELIKHQVKRDLDLVANVGATVGSEDMQLKTNDNLWPIVEAKLTAIGVDINQPWLIMHAGVSETKRRYPEKKWATAAKFILKKNKYQVLFTGSSSELSLTDKLQEMTGAGSFSIAGLFNIDEFICLVKHTRLMISVNTGAAHIAAACQTPLVVLYAQTNPQHTPWNVLNIVLPYAVPLHQRSKNEIIAYVNQTVYGKPIQMPEADDIVKAVDDLLQTIKITSVPTGTSNSTVKSSSC
ncbi:glycosyltransferase family 9 protein [Mucilaginibacter roseus]|uniref:Glycosyltransferase family 9 protein n=1 Tax=Mucilaginibacter roseus TaxID=1528868 RepID=A0ABS8U8Q8_9SPHI|nr:glycosyltransferase family 9 protein [Mucilaginibacter roseus]MCD8742171.1 glycosyltransferase family 9 protein [Mucilaginibacter roseus]